MRLLPAFSLFLSAGAIAAPTPATAVENENPRLDLYPLFRAPFRDEALRELEDDREDPGRPLSLEELAQAMSPEQKLGVQKKLERWKARALNGEFEDPKMLQKIAEAHRLLGDSIGAGLVASRLISADPKNPRGYAIAAEEFARTGRYDEIVKLGKDAPKGVRGDELFKQYYEYSKDRVSPILGLELKSPFEPSSVFGGGTAVKAEEGGILLEDGRPFSPGRIAEILKKKPEVPELDPQDKKNERRKKRKPLGPAAPISLLGAAMIVYGTRRSWKGSDPGVTGDPVFESHQEQSRYYEALARVQKAGLTTAKVTALGSLGILGIYLGGPYVVSGFKMAGGVVSSISGTGAAVLTAPQVAVAGAQAGGVVVGAKLLVDNAPRRPSMSHAQGEPSGNPVETGVRQTNTNNPTAQEIIAEKKKGSINREFPGQFKDKTLAEIQRAARRGDPAARKALKLLKDSRFNKK